MLNAARIVGFIPTTDASKARTFYEGSLGLRFVTEDRFAIIFDSNGITLRVVKLPEFHPVPFTILGWEVSDAEKTILWLRSKGVEFQRYDGMKQDELGIWKSPSGSKVAWFKDPDGNVLSISEKV